MWNKLSDGDKKVFVQTAQAAGAAQRKKVNEDEANGIAQLEQQGMKVIKTVDKGAFQAGAESAVRGLCQGVWRRQHQEDPDVK